MSRKTGRRSREETAELIREAAVLLLQRDGLRGFSNSVRLDDALTLLIEERDIRLTHGSVYGRIWNDQRDFQLDVVATTVARYDGAEIAAAIVSRFDEVRGGAAVDVVTALFDAAVAAARQSRMWNLWLGAHTAVVSTPGREDDERLAGALDLAQEQVASSITEALTQVTTGRDDSDLAGAAQVLLTQLVGASITKEGSSASALLVDRLFPGPPEPTTTTP